MTPDKSVQNTDKSYLLRGAVFAILWLLCLTAFLERASGLKESSWSDLLNFDQIEGGELPALGILLFLAVMFLALAIQNLFLHYRVRQDKE